MLLVLLCTDFHAQHADGELAERPALSARGALTSSRSHQVIPAPHGPTNPLQRRVFYGTAIHAVSLTETEYLSNTLIGVDEAGVITFVERSVAPDEVDERLRSLGWVDQAAQLVKLQKGEFLMPGCAALLPSTLLLRLTRPEQPHRYPHACSPAP